MRAVELGPRPRRPRRGSGVRHDRPEWVAAAHVLREYDEVTALSAPGAFDPAWILGAAADHLEADPEALDRLRAGLRLVVVDDAQELTPAALRLLQVVVGRGGVDLVLLGDPDAATQTFRGADPRLFVTAWPDAPTRRARRPRTGAVARCSPPRLGWRPTSGSWAAPRTARWPRPPHGGDVEAHLLRTAAQEAGYVAGRLREAHLLDGVPWSRMAVVVRGGGRTATLRRVLRGAGVPVDTATADLPVRDEAAVRPFLTLLRCALDVVAGAEQLDPADVVDVLTSPVGGADAVLLRRLRRSLRRLELDDGGGRPSDVLLAEAVLTPFPLGRIGPEAAPGPPGPPGARGGRRRPARRRGGRGRALADVERQRPRRPVARRRARRRSRRAAAPTATSMPCWACSTPPPRFVDRLPGASPADFLDHVLGQDVAGDTLVARAPAGESVALVTPAASAGLEWDLVVVAGVQEGVWPDLRLRGSLLGSTDLVDLVTGRGGDPRAARAPGAPRRDPALPRGGHPGPPPARRHRRAQRGRAALAVPRRRRPAAARRARSPTSPGR